MNADATDKTPEEIRYLVNRKGLTFADVDRMHGLVSGYARIAARKPLVAGEQAIANVLGMSPRQLWPSRFNPATGERLKPQPREHYKDRPRFRQRLIRGAA